ncbi:MAG: response regulator [Phycisphaeraceae bacterium]|nr:response regulator [Phycisphaeraceae bacterium]
MSNTRVLLADDQADVLKALRLLLKPEGFVIETASNGTEILNLVKTRDFDAVLMDMNYVRGETSGKQGLDTLSAIHQADSCLPVVVMTAWSSIELAVEAMRRGARDFVPKPWKNERLLSILRTQVDLGRALRKGQQLAQEVDNLKGERTRDMIAESPAMRPVLDMIARVGPSDANVLITGENGTGKGALSPSLYRNLYVGCQFFVMPSGGDIGEPCGISQQEAHAGGTPVIAHHQDGLKVTVSDSDFGDTRDPTNGIKFQSFTGGALLEAMLDAAQIYTRGHRRLYQDADGNPVKLTHEEMSFNAFNTDHRWLRLLHDYVKMYAQIHGRHLPEHLDALQLIVEMDMVSDQAPADAVLRKGLSVPEAIDKLIRALSCELSSVRRAAAKALIRLDAMKNVKHRTDIHSKLECASESPDALLGDMAKACLARMSSIK